MSSKLRHGARRRRPCGGRQRWMRTGSPAADDAATGHVAGNGGQPSMTPPGRAGIQPRHAGEQARSGVRMPRAVKRISTDIALLQHLRPAYITTTRRRDFGDDAEVMGDEQNAHPQLGCCSRRIRSSKHLRLHRDVERRGRFVGDQQARARRPAPWRSSRAAASRRTFDADSPVGGAPGPGCPRGRANPARAPWRRDGRWFGAR